MRKLVATLALIVVAGSRLVPWPCWSRSVRPLIAAAGLLALLAVAPAADAAIGRANLDGTAVDHGFIAEEVGFGVAVDDAHVYWTNFDPLGAADSVGRAGKDGSNVAPQFIVDVGSPRGIALSGDHIYWANSATESIARADIDGSDVDLAFIPDAGYPTAVAADAEHVYWGWVGAGIAGIGRARLDGTDVAREFVDPDGGAFSWGVPLGLAVSAEHVYWAAGVVVGRADIDGGDVIPVHVSPCIDNPSGCSASSVAVTGVAVAGGALYFSGTWPPVTGSDYVNAIGRANLDASATDLTFITTEGLPWALAADADHLYWGFEAEDATPTIDELIATVRSLGLPNQARRNLVVKLKQAQRSIDRGRVEHACGRLTSFADKVSMLSAQSIDPAEADALIADAEAIRESLGCP